MSTGNADANGGNTHDGGAQGLFGAGLGKVTSPQFDGDQYTDGSAFHGEHLASFDAQQDNNYVSSMLPTQPQQGVAEPSLTEAASVDASNDRDDGAKQRQLDATHAATLQALASLQSSTATQGSSNVDGGSAAAVANPSASNSDAPQAAEGSAGASVSTEAGNSNGVAANASTGPRPTDPSAATAAAGPAPANPTFAAGSIDATSAAQGDTSAPQAGDQQASSSAPAATAAAPAEPVLSKKIAEELRGIHAAAASIANFTAVHINKAAVPRVVDVQAAVNRALGITQALTSLLSAPEVSAAPNVEQPRSLYDFSAPATPSRGASISMMATYSPYDMSIFSSGRKRGGRASNQGSAARKRRRSNKGETKPEAGTPGTDKDGAAGGSGQHSRTQSQAGVGEAPTTPGGTRSDPDGSFAASLASPGGDDLEHKGPVYKKRSRAPATSPCASCGTLDSPEWRRGPDGARTLCNACGLHFSKLVRTRQRAMQEELPGGGLPLNPPPPVTIEELRASAKANDIGGPNAGPGSTPGQPKASAAISAAGTSGTPTRSTSGDPAGAATALTIAASQLPLAPAAQPPCAAATPAQSSDSLPTQAQAADPVAVPGSTSASGFDEASMDPQLRANAQPQAEGSTAASGDAPSLSAVMSAPASTSIATHDASAPNVAGPTGAPEGQQQMQAAPQPSVPSVARKSQPPAEEKATPMDEA